MCWDVLVDAGVWNCCVMVCAMCKWSTLKPSHRHFTVTKGSGHAVCACSGGSRTAGRLASKRFDFSLRHFTILQFYCGGHPARTMHGAEAIWAVCTDAVLYNSSLEYLQAYGVWFAGGLMMRGQAAPKLRDKTQRRRACICDRTDRQRRDVNLKQSAGR